MENLKDKRLFLLDMDGTIYIDDLLFDHSLEFLSYIKSIGGKYMFLTNNSSKSVVDYINKLTKMGMEVDQSNFMTSSQATAIYLHGRYTSEKIYVLGTQSLKAELKSSGLNVVDKYEEDIEVLLVGYDTELAYFKLEDACKLLTKEIAYYATNPDWVCPVSYGYVPDCGSFCQMLEIATGKNPIFIGKPEPTMVDLAVKSSGFSKEQTLMIGDRIYTDIASGKNAGVATCLVLSGETKREDLAQNEIKPDYVLADIGELLSRMK